MADEKKVLSEKASVPQKSKEAESAVVNSAAEKKPAAKRTPTAKKAAAKRTTATKAQAAKTPKKKEPALDDITAALWKKVEKADLSKIEGTVAIQVNVENMGVFYVSIKDGNPDILPFEYNDRDGNLFCSYDDAMKIAKGGFDYSAAINSNAFRYYGDLNKALILKNLFN